MDHSILAPSNADQWVNCSGSVQLNLLTGPKPSTDPADEGSIVADIAAELVEGITRGQLPGRASSKLWDCERNGIYVTKEMVDGALMYAKRLEKVIQYSRVFGGPNIGIERKMDIRGIHPACFGTPDFWLYDKDDDRLIIYELKFGYGIVEPFENWQMLCYANGIFNLIETKPKNIDFIVVQPRAPHKSGPVRGWLVKDPKQLEPYFDRLRKAADLAMSANPPTMSGPHCRYCPSILNCDTARNAAGCVLDFVGGLTTTKTADSSLWFELFILKRAQEILKHRITAIETEVESKIRLGEVIPRFKMSPKMSNRFWTIPHEQIIELGKSYKADLNVEKTLTPKQAIDAGLPEQIVECFSKREKRGVKLEFDDLKQARFIFNQPS